MNPEQVTAIAALVGPITTLAGALGGVWITQHRQEIRDLREAKRAAYVQWLQFAENVSARLFQPNAAFLTWVKELHDRMAEMALVSSQQVRKAVRAYIDTVEGLLPEIQAMAEPGPSGTPLTDAQIMAAMTELATRFRTTLDPYRDRVLEKMRHDVGFK